MYLYILHFNKLGNASNFFTTFKQNKVLNSKHSINIFDVGCFPPAHNIIWVQGELDELCHESALSEERAQKAMIDAARLADELRSEQEAAMACEKDRKLLEAQVKDIVTRYDEAETNALKVRYIFI